MKSSDGWVKAAYSVMVLVISPYLLEYTHISFANERFSQPLSIVTGGKTFFRKAMNKKLI